MIPMVFFMIITVLIPSEAVIKFLQRHAGEYQHPAIDCFDWILACARMTDH
jgi:hypothetical protein